MIKSDPATSPFSFPPPLAPAFFRRQPASPCRLTVVPFSRFDRENPEVVILLRGLTTVFSALPPLLSLTLPPFPIVLPSFRTPSPPPSLFTITLLFFSLFHHSLFLSLSLSVISPVRSNNRIISRVIALLSTQLLDNFSPSAWLRTEARAHDCDFIFCSFFFYCIGLVR